MTVETAIPILDLNGAAARVKSTARLHAARERLDDMLARLHEAAPSPEDRPIGDEGHEGPEQRHSSLPDEVLAAFHVACDGRDMVLAARLLAIADDLLKSPARRCEFRAGSVPALAAAYRRIWNAGVPGEPHGNSAGGGGPKAGAAAWQADVADPKLLAHPAGPIAEAGRWSQ